jgi:hypothetical protein
MSSSVPGGLAHVQSLQQALSSLEVPESKSDLSDRVCRNWFFLLNLQAGRRVRYGRRNQRTHQLRASSVCSSVIFSSINAVFTVIDKSCISIVPLCQTLQISCRSGSSNGGLQGLSWFSQPPAIQRLALLVTDKSFLRSLKKQCLKISLLNGFA